MATTLVVDGQNPPDTICVARRQRGASAGRRSLRRSRRLRAHRPQRGDRRVHREPHLCRAAKRSDLELTIAGTADYISMVEAGAEEISEEDMLAAMDVRPGGHRRVLREAGASSLVEGRTPSRWSSPSMSPIPASPSAWRTLTTRWPPPCKDADKQSRMGKVEELKARHQGGTSFSEEERAAVEERHRRRLQGA